MSMKKMCIYVEGQTEQLFVEKLITEIANKNNIAITVKSLKGGGKNSTTAKQLIVLKDKPIDENTKYYILIVNCNADNRVQSEINENCLNMQNSGYEKVFGVRDLFPKDLKDLPKILKYAVVKNPDLKITAKSIIAVFEIETWFLAEYRFLEKIDSRLTLPYIIENLGFDLENDCLDQDMKYHHSAGILNKIYQSVDRSYNKTYAKSEKIIKNLDYEILYLITKNKLKSLQEFINELDNFFTIEE